MRSVVLLHGNPNPPYVTLAVVLSVMTILLHLGSAVWAQAWLRNEWIGLPLGSFTLFTLFDSDLWLYAICSCAIYLYIGYSRRVAGNGLMQGNR